MKVVVAVAHEQGVDLVEVTLPGGARVADALRAARVEERHPGLAVRSRLGIWSRECAAHSPLRDGDRVEVYRDLRADPKSMRRAKAKLRPSTRSRNAP